MKATATLTILMFTLLSGQSVNAQINYSGKVNLNRKDNSFNLVSSSDSFNIMIEKKNLRFDNQEDFSFIRTDKNNFILVQDGESISIKDTKNQIEYSSGLILYPVKKNNKQIIVKNKDGNVVLDGKFNLKRGVSDFNIAIFDSRNKNELLSYAVHYLYFKSKNLNNANNTPPIYFYTF